MRHLDQLASCSQQSGIQMSAPQAVRNAMPWICRTTRHYPPTRTIWAHDPTPHIALSFIRQRTSHCQPLPPIRMLRQIQPSSCKPCSKHVMTCYVEKLCLRPYTHGVSFANLLQLGPSVRRIPCVWWTRWQAVSLMASESMQRNCLRLEKTRLASHLRCTLM